MAGYDSKVDISTTNPYPLGNVRVLCHGTDITMHVPSTGTHLTAKMAREIAANLNAAALAAEYNRANVGF